MFNIRNAEKRPNMWQKRKKKKTTNDNPIHLVPKWNHIKRTLDIKYLCLPT